MEKQNEFWNKKNSILLILLMLVNVEFVSAEPGKLVHNPWNPPGVYLGITSDNIGLKNDIKLCQPVPTDDVNEGVKWNWCDTDFTYSLQQFDKNSAQYFPLNDLPSGGNSGRISKSEMVIAVVDLLDNDPKDGWIIYSWYKKNAGGSGTDKLLVQTEKLSVPACAGYPHFDGECGMYGSYEQFSYIGHFSGEIENGGYYFVIIDTSWGSARIDFGVVPIDNSNKNPGDGVQNVITPVPVVTQVVSYTPVATSTITSTSNSFSYNTGEWVGSGLQSFLSGMAHGFWNGIFG
jgi:hypothetical protein